MAIQNTSHLIDELVVRGLAQANAAGLFENIPAHVTKLFIVESPGLVSLSGIATGHLEALHVEDNPALEEIYDVAVGPALRVVTVCRCPSLRTLAVDTAGVFSLDVSGTALTELSAETGFHVGPGLEIVEIVKNPVLQRVAFATRGIVDLTLSDNALTSLDGIIPDQWLRVLCAARNPIETLGNFERPAGLELWLGAAA